MLPLISCLVPTIPNRETFWPTMFRSFNNDIWPNKEIILIGEGESKSPIPENVKYIETPLGTSIGKKLNIGVKFSSANYFQKRDDDDWYSPNFLSTTIKPLLSCPKLVSIAGRHITFLVKEWELYEMPLPTLGGGTICFDRSSWEQKKFKDLSFGEDQDFINNREKISLITPNPLNYVLIRHGNNTWKTWSNGKTVEEVAKTTGTLIPGGPESFFSKDDLNFYQSLRS